MAESRSDPKPPKGEADPPNLGNDNADSERIKNCTLFVDIYKGSKQQDLRNGEGPNGDMYGGLGNRWLLNGSKGLGGLGG